MRSLLLPWWILLLHTSHAQQAPNPDIQLDLFDYPPDGSGTFRTNLCNASRRVFDSHELDLGDVLRDIDLKVALYFEFANFDIETDANGEEIGRRLNKDYPGLVPRILDELCERAGCRWRDTYAATPVVDASSNKTFTDLLMWSSDVYDIAADWWLRSVERLRQGITYSEAWFDGTIIMVAEKSVAIEDTFDPWGWLAPFAIPVWICIVATVLFSALVYMLLEYCDPETDGRDGLGFVEGIWMFATAYTGQFEFMPSTGPARLLTFSTAFWALLMITAYTANLASFLVIRRQVEPQMVSVEQAVSRNKRMCVWKNTQMDTAVSRAFPNYARSGLLVRTSQPGVYETLRRGGCDIALTQVSTWKAIQFDNKYNGDCQLEWIGRPFKPIPAAFGFKADVTYQCTSLLRDAVNLYMHAMEQDGTIEALWDEHISKSATVDCTLAAGAVIGGGGGGNETSRRRLVMNGSREEEENPNIGSMRRRLNGAAAGAVMLGGDDTEQKELSLVNMGGVFLIHAILTGASVIWAFCLWMWGPKEEDEEKKGKNDTVSDLRDEMQGKMLGMETDMRKKLYNIEEKLIALLAHEKDD